MGDPKQLSYELALACDNLTKNYQETLNQSADLDEQTRDALYNLGADVKHTFDYFAEAIRKYTAE